MKKTPPMWIVIPDATLVTSTLGVNSNPVLKQMLEKDYLLMGNDAWHQYYRHKEN
ncbi:MAG: hypothetical protein ACK5MK_01645 [Dysgonomonas sp.]